MATGLEIINKALRLIGDNEIVASSLTTNSYALQVLEGLNYILRDIYTRNPKWAILENKTTLATVADTQSYSLPSGIERGSKIRSIVHPDNYVLKKITREEYESHLIIRDFEDDLTTGSPIFYWTAATAAGTEKIYFYPIPTTAETLDIWYQSDFSTLISSSNVSTASVIPFKEGDLNMVVAGVMWMASERLGSEDRERYKAMYKEALILNTIDQDNSPETWEIDPYFAKGFI